MPSLFSILRLTNKLPSEDKKEVKDEQKKENKDGEKKKEEEEMEEVVEFAGGGWALCLDQNGRECWWNGQGKANAGSVIFDPPPLHQISQWAGAGAGNGGGGCRSCHRCGCGDAQAPMLQRQLPMALKKKQPKPKPKPEAKPKPAESGYWEECRDSKQKKFWKHTKTSKISHKDPYY